MEDGDVISIDIPNRGIALEISEDELAARRERLLKELGGFRPRDRERPVTAALRAYAAMATSASTGAARDVSQVE